MKKAVILGGARCLWEDLAALGKWRQDAATFAVNMAGLHYEERIDHWVTLHPEKFCKDVMPKRLPPLNQDYTVWSHARKHKNVQKTIPDWGGSSGLLAVKVSLTLEFDKIVLAGVPMDPQPHFDRPGEWLDYVSYRRNWIKFKPAMQDRVRSMSGWTKELLGGPDDVWLNGGEAAKTRS